MLSNMIRLWRAQIGSSPYLPLAGLPLGPPSTGSRISSPPLRYFQASSDTSSKEGSFDSPDGREHCNWPRDERKYTDAADTAYTHRFTWTSALRSFVAFGMLAAILALAAFGMAMLFVIIWGKIVFLPRYTLYDVAQVGWNRPLLDLSPSPSSTDAATTITTKGSTGTTVYNLDSPTAFNATAVQHAVPREGANDQHILILSPLKNAEKVLAAFFALLDKLEHPKDNTSIGFLLSDEEDNTGSMVIDWVRQQRDKGEYRHITLLRKDFGMLSPDKRGRHQDWVQTQRRALMGKARTLLLMNTLNSTVDWVLWLDSDVADFPSSLVSDLLLYGDAGLRPSSAATEDTHTQQQQQELFADVIVPNVMYRPGGRPNAIHSYDLNSWAETAASKVMKVALPADVVLHESDPKRPTFRQHLAQAWVPPNISDSWDMTSPFWPLDPANASHPLSDLYDPQSEAYIGRTMELDAVGGVATLVRAQTYMYGAVFPSWAEDHQLETEGFGVVSKKLGARIVGLPNYLVFHPW